MRKGRLHSLANAWRVAYVFVVFVLVAGSCAAQFSGPAVDRPTKTRASLVPTTDPAILFPASREIELGAGDLVAVHLYGLPDYAPIERVALDGTLQLPLMGTVQVSGLTIHQTEDLIAKRLIEAGMYQNPQVTLQLMESPNEAVTVSGEMHGVIPVAGGKRLFDVLAAAGGLPPTASHVIVINRPGVTDPIVVDMGSDPGTSNYANVPVFPRDTVVVSRVGVVYVLGAFKTQGPIILQQNAPLTLMQAASQAGGPGFEGKYNDLRLIRTNGPTRTVVEVDLKKVINGKEPDPVLEANDVIYLPTNNTKSALKNGGVGTLLGIVSILLYAVHP
jgi:polysaccharide biosynthesis/export protein